MSGALQRKYNSANPAFQGRPAGEGASGAPAGRLVRTLVNEPLFEGWNRAVWNGRDDYSVKLPSGVYAIRVATPSGSASRKVVLLQ